MAIANYLLLGRTLYPKIINNNYKEQNGVLTSVAHMHSVKNQGHFDIDVGHHYY